MAIQILPFEESDIPAAVRLQLDAFKSHPRTRINWPLGYTDAVYEFYESTRRKDFHDPECAFYKAVDANTGALLAISEWTLIFDPPPAKDVDEEAELARLLALPPPDNFPPEGNWRLRQWFKANGQRLLRQYFGGKPYMLLDILTVTPAAQGKGIGAQLLQWGLDQADARGLPIGLESTPAGLSLYKRAGFVQEEVIDLDMKQFGVTEDYDPEAAQRVWMVRSARARQ